MEKRTYTSPLETQAPATSAEGTPRLASLLASPAHCIGLALRLCDAKRDPAVLAAVIEALERHAASGDAAARLALDHVRARQAERSEA